MATFPKSFSISKVLVALCLFSQICTIVSENPSQKIYVQGARSSRNCSYNCKGSFDDPFDSLLSALKFVGSIDNASVEILLLKASSHFVLIKEPEEEMMQQIHPSLPSSASTSKLYLDFSNSSGFILPSSLNVTIRPAICGRDVNLNVTPRQSDDDKNCYQAEESATIVFKSFDFQIVVQNNLILRDLNFIGNEDISVFNSYSNQTSVTTCLSNRIRCCANPEEPLYPNIICTGNVTIRNLTTDTQSASVFLLNQTQTNLTPQLMFNNCNFQRISLTTKKNFITMGTENSHNLKISSSNFSEIFTPYGLIGVYSSVSVGMSPLAEPSKTLSQSIDITSSVFNDFNPSISFVMDQDSPDSDGYILNIDSQYGGNITVDSTIIKKLKGSRTSAIHCLDCSDFLDPFSAETLSLLPDFADRFVRDHYFTPTSSIFRVHSLSGSLTMSNNFFYQNVGKSGTILSVNQLAPEGKIELSQNTFDGNFATAGFPTVRISANIANYFNSSICGNVIIDNNTFRNHLTCRNGYGNLMLFCGTIRNPASITPALGLSEALVNLINERIKQPNASNVLYADEIFPQYYRWNNLTISNNLFEKNLILLSNSISIFGGSNVEVINNTFSANGVPLPTSPDFQVQSAYFDQIAKPEAFSFNEDIPYLTTALIIEQTKDMTFIGNIFSNNWNLYNTSEVFPSQIYLRNLPEFFPGFSMKDCFFRDMTLKNDTIPADSQLANIRDALAVSSPLIGISYLHWPAFLTYQTVPSEMILGLSLLNVTFENNTFNLTNLNEMGVPNLYDPFDDSSLGIIKIFCSKTRTRIRPRTLYVNSSLISNNRFYGTKGYLFSNTDFATILVSKTIFQNNLAGFNCPDHHSSECYANFDFTDTPPVNIVPNHHLVLIVAMSSAVASGFVSIDQCGFKENEAMLVFGYSNSYVQIQNTDFQRNKWREGGLIVGIQSTFLQTLDSNFTENDVKTGIIVLQASQFIDSRNLFYKNTATICNGYFLDGVLGFQISDSRFIQNSLHPDQFWIVDWHVPLASTLWLIDSQGTLERTAIEKNTIRGGFIHMKSSIVSLDSCSISDNRAEGGIGLGYVSSSSQIKLLRTNITRNEHEYDYLAQAGRFHAGMFVITSSNVLIDSSRITYNVLGNGSGFLKGQDVALGISNTLFLTNYDFSADVVQGSTYLIYVSFSSVDVSNSNFTYNGQLLKLIDSISFLNGNLITGFQFGLTGTQILIDVESGSLSIRNNDFYQTTGGLTSLLMMRAYEADLQVSRCTFDSINQGTQPMFKITGKSAVMKDLFFKSISSTQALVSLSDMDGCKISKVAFSCNSYWKTAVSSLNVGNLTLRDISICHNSPSNILQISSSKIFIMKNVSISKLIRTFNYLTYSYYNSLPLVKLENNLKVVIADVHVKNQVTFTSNFFIMSNIPQSAIVIANSTFVSNQASEGGAITFVLSNVNAVNISNTTFINNSAVQYSQEETTRVSKALNGGAIKLICADDDLSLCDIDIRNCAFQNNSGLAGGAIYWEGYPPLVKDTMFEGNVAEYGPILASKSIRMVPWFPDIGKMVTLDINQYIEEFRAVRAWPGVANLAIAPSDLEQFSPEKCSGYTLSTCYHFYQLTGNITKEIYGVGLSKWGLHQMNLPTSESASIVATPETEMNSNFSKETPRRRLQSSVGNEIMGLFPSEDSSASQLVNKVHNQQTVRVSRGAINIYDVVSGVPMDQAITLALIDIYGQVVTTNNNSVLSQESSNDSSRYRLTIQGAYVKASSGIIGISNLIAEYYPGYSSEATFKVSRIAHLPESLKIVDYFAELSSQRNVNINFSFRDCIDGEYFEATSNQARCTICKENTFTIAVANNSEKPCGLCDKTTMICLGGSLVAPAAGYWRLNQTADIFMRCPNAESCLGGWNETTGNFSYSGFCEDTYSGPLCSKCQVGFAKYKNGSPCVDCRKNVWYYLRFAVTMLIQGLFIVFNIKTNLFIYQNHKNESFRHLRTRSFLLKMLTNYLQVISLIDSFSSSWPGFLRGLFSANGSANASSDDAFAMDCLIYLIFGQINTSLRFVKATIALLMPLLLAVFLFIFWGAYFIIKKWRHRDFQFSGNLFKNYVIGSTIIVAFNLQPMVLSSGFLLFQCQNIYRTDSPLYHMVGDYDVQCWTSSHLLWAATTGVLTISLWGIIVPLIIFFKVRRAKRSVLKFEGTKALKYSFIVFGYKEETWYWEFVILIRKYLILIIITSVAGFSRGSQFTLIMLVVLVASLLHKKYQPYESAKLNQLETVSLFSIELFVVACLYFSSIDRINGLDIPIIIFCVLGNIVFVLRWLILFCKTVVEHLRGYAFFRKGEALVMKVTLVCKLRIIRKDKSNATQVSRENSYVVRAELPHQLAIAESDSRENMVYDIKDFKKEICAEDSRELSITNEVRGLINFSSFLLRKSSNGSSSRSRPGSLEDLPTGCSDKSTILTTKHSRRQTLNFTEQVQAVIQEIPDSANFSASKVQAPQAATRLRNRRQPVERVNGDFSLPQANWQSELESSFQHSKSFTFGQNRNEGINEKEAQHFSIDI